MCVIGSTVAFGVSSE